MHFSAFEEFVSLVADRYGEPGRPHVEEQNSAYESGVVRLGSETWRIRTARVTPTKTGAFVAVWQRNADGETRPFDSAENIDGLLVFVREEQRFGVFRFSTQQLEDQGVTSSKRFPGKRGFRLYPHWTEDLNAQAARTQRIQAASFEMLS